MYKIYCLNNISPEGLALLTDNYEVTENIDEADAILVRSADMHEMEVPANLKAVARAGAGVNNIPLDKFAEAGIAVFNTPGANANAVKELVLAGMLLASRDIIGGVAWVRDNADDENVGKAAEKAKKQFAGGEILGKTLGVIGLGAIGKLVAQSAEALGMKVIGYDPAMDEITVHEQISPTVEFADLPKVLKESDFITIHVPALPATKGMINADAIAQMKDGVVFLNFSRDVLVDDAAMAEALESGKVQYVAADAVVGSYVSNNAGMDVHMVALMQQASGYCVGVLDGNTQLKQAVSNALSAMNSNGVSSVIQKKWLGTAMDLSGIKLTAGASDDKDDMSEVLNSANAAIGTLTGNTGSSTNKADSDSKTSSADSASSSADSNSTGDSSASNGAASTASN